LVRNHFACIWCWDKPRANSDSLDLPRPGLGGSHHLPPYSIIYSSARRLRPNGSFSRDSQGGVPKLSRFGLPRLWAFITSRLKLGSERVLNQTCSSCRELSNAVLHSCCRRREEVDSWLFVVGSQTASLTPGPSFARNLGCRCPNGSCKAILDIYTSRPFQWHKEHSNTRRFDPELGLWVFGSPGRLQLPTFGSVGFTLTPISKWGCDTITYSHVLFQMEKLFKCQENKICLNINREYNSCQIKCSICFNYKNMNKIFKNKLMWPIIQYKL
jgi:hypothetical protein